MTPRSSPDTPPQPANDEAAAAPARRPIRTAKALRDAAREHCRDAIEALAAVVRTEGSAAARIAAANALLDRGFGKARVDPDAGPERLPDLPERRLVPVFIKPKPLVEDL